MKAYDFTKGNVLRQLILFSMPIMLGNALQVSFQFIDSLWIGNLLGAKALGAAAVSSTIVLTVLFILGLNNATLTILSQQKGKDDEKGMASYINAFVVLLTGLSIGFGAAVFPVRTIAASSANAGVHDSACRDLFADSIYRHTVFVWL